MLQSKPVRRMDSGKVYGCYRAEKLWNGFQKSRNSIEQNSEWIPEKCRLLQGKGVVEQIPGKCRMLQGRAVVEWISVKCRMLQNRAVVECIPRKCRMHYESGYGFWGGLIIFFSATGLFYIKLELESPWKMQSNGAFHFVIF